jgi:protein-S-isoprenylcysteine O-methyltransferase Ste14
MQSIGFWGLFQLVGLGLFLATKAGLAVGLRVRYKVNPIKLRARKLGLQGLIELSMFAHVALWATVVVIRTVAPGVLSGSWLFSTWVLFSRAARAAGLLAVVLAFAILIPAQISLGAAWRLGIDEETPGELVTAGIYAFSRNPIYLFFDLYFLGTFLLNGTLFFGLSALFTWLNLHYQILGEERHLADLFGSDYLAYCEHTPRYLTLPRGPGSQRKAQQADLG